MRKQTIKIMRRKQLTEAAFDVLKKHGISGTTFDKVAKQAGLSKGILQHYFSGKEALFEAVLRESNAVTQQNVTVLFGHSNSSWERLYAIIYGNFAPTVFQREVCHAWVCLCAEVPQNPQYERIQTVIHSRMRSNLMSSLRFLVDSSLAEKIAFNLTTMIDGLWMRAALQPEPMSSEEAISHLEFTLDKLFEGAKVDDSQRAMARDKISTVSGILFKV